MKAKIFVGFFKYIFIYFSLLLQWFWVITWCYCFLLELRTVLTACCLIMNLHHFATQSRGQFLCKGHTMGKTEDPNWVTKRQGCEKRLSLKNSPPTLWGQEISKSATKKILFPHQAKLPVSHVHTCSFWTKRRGLGALTSAGSRPAFQKKKKTKKCKLLEEVLW